MTLRKGNENDVAGPGYFPLELHPKIMGVFARCDIGGDRMRVSGMATDRDARVGGEEGDAVALGGAV